MLRDQRGQLLKAFGDQPRRDPGEAIGLVEDCTIGSSTRPIPPYPWHFSLLTFSNDSEERSCLPRFDYSTAARGIYHAMDGMDRYLAASSFDPALLMPVQLRASQVNGCAYWNRLSIAARLAPPTAHDVSTAAERDRP